MLEGQLEPWIARIEAHIEAAQLDAARQLLTQAATAFGASPRLDHLSQRLLEVERLAGTRSADRGPAERGPADDLIRQAQDDINRANYAEALTALRQAIALRPEDANLQSLLEQTEKAAARHSETQAKHRAILQAAAQIGQLLDQHELTQARTQLQQAGFEFGRHDALIALQQRLQALEAAAVQERTRQVEQRLTSLYEAQNWRGVLHESEVLLRLEPDHANAFEMQQKARRQIETEESRRHHRQAIETARQDIERLVTAQEWNQASERLQHALQTLGDDPDFSELKQRIHRSRSDLQFRQRVEWAERRANEAERLIHEANRQSLQGEFDEAIQRLEGAQELDPSHPEIPDKLATAYAARDRQRQERQRFEHLTAQLQEIQGHLNALRLDDAAGRIALTQQEFGDDERLMALRQRLEKLRSAEAVSARLSPGADGTAAPGQTLQLLRQRQDAWFAYSWKQALLFPLRGQGPKNLAMICGVLIGLDLLAFLPWVGAAFGLLRLLVPCCLLGLAVVISRATVGGKNHLDSLPTLFATPGWGRDALRLLGLSLLLGAPAIFWLLSHDWHQHFTASAGPLGWWAVGLLLWPVCLLLVTALGASATFGDGALFRLRSHLQAFPSLPSSAVMIGHGLFAVVMAVFFLRGVVVPQVAALGIPLQALVEAYAYFAWPHLVGSMMRRRGVDLAPLYLSHPAGA